MALRVLSYNILAGGEGRLTRLTRVVQSQRPAMVALLEARSRPHVEVLARALQMEPIIGEATNRQDHVAWLSRFPVVRAKNHQLPIFAKTLLEIEVVIDFASPDLAQRLVTCEVVTGGEAETASDHYPTWAEFLAEVALYPPVKKAS